MPDSNVFWGVFLKPDFDDQHLELMKIYRLKENAELFIQQELAKEALLERQSPNRIWMEGYDPDSKFEHWFIHQLSFDD